jgi:acyl carrier protein
VDAFRTIVKDAIAYVCDVDAENIRDHDTLEALGIDSVIASQLIIETEIRFGAEVPVEILETLDGSMTVAEISDALRPEVSPELLPGADTASSGGGS